MAEEAKKTGLEFLVSLVDQITGPVGKVASKVQMRFTGINDSINAATGNMKTGFIAGTGAAIGLVAAMGPAIRMNKELANVAALGVGAAALDALKSEALELSNQFGVSAEKVVANARTIKATLGDIGEAELLRVTRAATLAGEALGMEDAPKQLAKSMQKITEAQQVLGMNLTDNTGRALGPTALIEKLRDRFGQIDTARESGLIKKAFGDEALPLMTTLINNSEILRGDLTSIGKTDLGRRLKDAADPFDRLWNAMKNVKIVWGGALIPLVTPWIDAVTDMAKQMQAWAGRYPSLTRAIAGVTTVLLLMATAVGAAKFGWGLLQLATVPFRATLWGINVALIAQNIIWAIRHPLLAAETLLIKGAMIVGAAYTGVLKIWTGIQWFATAAQWAFNAAMLANPITWVVVGVIALIAAIALAIIYWDKIKEAAGAAIDWIGGRIQWLIDLVGDGFANAWKSVAGPGTVLGTLIDLLKSGAGEELSVGLTRLPATEPLSPEARAAISNVANSDSSRKTTIGQVTINPKEEVGPDYLTRTLVAEGWG